MKFRRKKYEEIIVGVVQALRKYKRATLATIHKYLLQDYIKHNRYGVTLRELAFIMRYLRKTGRVTATYDKHLKVYWYELNEDNLLDTSSNTC